MMPPAGTMIPEGVVPSSFCGTHGTGWMNGVHPTTIGEKVDRKICFHWDGVSCLRNRNIDVTNCGEYYVYLLHNAPACQYRYCAYCADIAYCKGNF